MIDISKKESYKTVEKLGVAVFIDRKSKFIAHTKPVATEQEALSFLAEMRAEYSDANHNVYAYIIDENNIFRYSDDGEPGGTAGMPILEVLKREGLSGVCVVVTRYFGGILLGAGGLVRAYAKGAKLGVDAAGVVEFVPYVVFSVSLSYSDYEKIQKEAAKYGVSISDTAFEESVKLSMSAKKENYELFSSFISDYTGGKCVCEITGETYGPA